MNHKNGISDFNHKSLEEREAEIFAGIVLPNAEIQNGWQRYDDIMRPDVIARVYIIRLVLRYGKSNATESYST